MTTFEAIVVLDDFSQVVGDAISLHDCGRLVADTAADVAAGAWDDHAGVELAICASDGRMMTDSERTYLLHELRVAVGSHPVIGDVRWEPCPSDDHDVARIVFAADPKLDPEGT